MATFTGFVDSQCGTVNPLVQISQAFAQDKTHVLQDGLVQASASHTLNVDPDRVVNQYVQEYHRPLDAPTTFHLDRVLSNLQVSTNPIVDERERQWARDFFTQPSPVHQPLISQNQSHTQRNAYFQSEIPFINDYPSLNFPSVTNSLLSPTTMNYPVSQEEKNLRDYLKEMEATDSTKSPDTAILTSVHNSDSSFVNQFLNNDLFSTMFDSDAYDAIKEIPTEYKFIEKNPYLNHADPFQAGCERLRVHDIVNAALYFEAAVQKDPNHVDAWLHLGMTMSENEQDPSAIVALNKCIALDSNNLQAYLILASCYANESLMSEATNALANWLSKNPKYAKFLPVSTAEDPANYLNMHHFEKVKNAFLLAIPGSTDRIDDNLQVGLGILFHLSCDYDKAAECFQTAISANPTDARLWNKLGASLANGGQSEKAIDAYYQALTLSPGFVRARYNLGISCFNLRAYAQAIEHFLTALKQQSEGIGPMGSHVQMSENIWRTLGIALGHLDRDDLSVCVKDRDLSKLLQEFRIE